MDNFFRNILTESIEIKSLITVHYFKYSRDFTMEGEVHDFYELVFADSGRADIVDGQDKLQIAQGQAYLHRPNVFHSIKAANEFTNIIVVTFECEKLDADSICGRIFKFNPVEKQLLSEIVSEAGQSFSEPLDIVYLTKMTLKEKIPLGSLQIIKNNLEKLLLYFLRRDTRDEKILPENNQKLFIYGKIIDYLKKNIFENITLDDVSQHLGYSTAYLKKIFFSLQKCGIIHYHLLLKIEYAKKLIAEDNLSLYDISYKLSFSSPQYFSRLFKTLTNMTPSQFRQSVKASKLLI